MIVSDKILIIFEMANNHGGSVEHGKLIIESMREASKDIDCFDYAIKFQYRAQSFIHSSFRQGTNHKYVRRFTETRLSPEQYMELAELARSYGWRVICTPFDEESVELIEKQNLDVIKIASCSLTDWPLLERVSKAGKPVIASTATATLDNIDRVVSFFSHRGIELALMHCVAEYPTDEGHAEINQIDVLRNRYP